MNEQEQKRKDRNPICKQIKKEFEEKFGYQALGSLSVYFEENEEDVEKDLTKWL